MRSRPKLTALRRGGAKVGSVAREASRRLASPALRRTVRRAISALAGAAAMAARVLLLGASYVEAIVAGLLRYAARPMEAAVAVLGLLLTPARAATIAAMAGFSVLAISQFTDLRGVAIGRSRYEDVAPLTSAPVTETWTAWSAHGPLVLALGLLATVAIAAAMAGRPRARQATTVAALASAGALVVVLAIDLPAAGGTAGLDEQYANAEGVLLDGFYAQLAGAATLLGVSLASKIWGLVPRRGER